MCLIEYSVYWLYWSAERNVILWIDVFFWDSVTFSFLLGMSSGHSHRHIHFCPCIFFTFVTKLISIFQNWPLCLLAVSVRVTEALFMPLSLQMKILNRFCIHNRFLSKHSILYAISWVQHIFIYSITMRVFKFLFPYFKTKGVKLK